MPKNILLIGGSHGIGFELAQSLMNDNTVYIASRTNENLGNLDVNHIITKEKKLGFGKAVNYGVNLVAKKNYTHVIILNQDAYFQENHFKQFTSELSINNEDFVCPLLFTEEFKEIIPFVRERYFNVGVPKEKVYIADYVGVTVACSIKLWNDLDGLDEQFFMYFEENDIFKRASKDKPILLLPHVHVAHRNKDEKMKGEELDWFYKSEMLFALKHESKMKYIRLKLKYYLRKLIS